MADSFTDGSCLLYNCTKRIGFPQMIYCKDRKSSVAVERPYVGDLLFAGEGSLSIGDLITTKRVEVGIRKTSASDYSFVL